MTALLKPWTAEQLQRLNELKAQIHANGQGLSWIEIGADLGRSWAACKVQYFYQLRLKRQPKGEHGKPQTRMTVRQTGMFAAMEAREQMSQLPARSLTAEFFGDPLPGRSALDRRRERQGNGVRSVSLATEPMQ